jgi:alcohol dehydrogenase
LENFDATIREKILFGAGRLNEAGRIARQTGSSALIVTTKGEWSDELSLKVSRLLADEHVKSHVFNNIEENPRPASLDAGALVCREKGCDLVIGLGGGSAMDAAKVIALLAASEGKTEDYMRYGKYFGQPEETLKCLPIICIPTTAGTGSEVTQVAVITHPTTRCKPGMSFNFFHPAFALVDPELTLSLPPDITANTGLDVLFHALESLLSKKATPFTRMIARESIHLVITTLEQAVRSPGDIEARSRMAWASTLGGIVMSNAGTTAIHGLGHTAGGHTNAPHGLTLCAVGPAVLRYTYSANIAAHAEAARLLGAPMEGNEEETASQCGEFLRRFLTRFGKDIPLDRLGITKDMIPGLTQGTRMYMIRSLANTWMTLSDEDISSIYEDCMQK